MKKYLLLTLLLFCFATSAMSQTLTPRQLAIRSLSLYDETLRRYSSSEAYQAGISALYGLDGTAKDLKQAEQMLTRAFKEGEGRAALALAYMSAQHEDYKTAWKWIEQGKQADDLNCQLMEAQFLAAGLGTEADEAKAAALCDEMLRLYASNIEILTFKGTLHAYASTPGVNSLSRALKYWEQGDRLGHAACQMALGRHYADGLSESIDHTVASRYFKSVADGPSNFYQGEACYRMAVMHYLGNGVEQNEPKALHYMRRAAKLGSADAASYLAHHYGEQQNSQDSSIFFYRRAIALGNTDELINLGEAFADRGLYAEALECFEQYAALGHADGHLWAAMACEASGDSAACLNHLNLGHKQGCRACTQALGTIYEFGTHGTKANLKTADNCYKAAATPQANYRRAMLRLNGQLPKEESLGMELLRTAADSGYVDAIYILAYCYETGEHLDSADFGKALSLYRLLADNDVAEGQYRMGLIYEQGEGPVETDLDKAFEYYNLAAAQGHGDALCAIGDFYADGRLLPKDEESAFKLYTQAAEAQSAQALYRLGCCHLSGLGTVKDSATAVACLRAGALAGSGNAAYRIGDMFDNGEYLAQSRDSAYNYYVLGHKAGHPYCTFRIGELFYETGLYDQCAKFLYDAAVGGYPKAILLYAKMEQQGLGGLTADPEEAYQLFEIAAHSGQLSDAYTELGAARMSGIGCARDAQLAKHYFDTAAAMGNATAMYDLGICYLDGYGCRENIELALHWLEQAAGQGSILAMNRLGDILMDGQYVKKDPKQAARHYQAALQRGSLEAYCRMGECYERGKGVILNSRKAFEHYQTAAGHGYIPAMRHLARCYELGIGTAPSREQAIYWTSKAEGTDTAADTSKRKRRK